MKRVIKFDFQITLGIIAILIIVHLSSCSSDQQSQNEENTDRKEGCLDASFQQQLTYTTADSTDMVETLSLTGNVEYDPDGLVHFVSLVGGVITNVNFSLGEKVHKGQLLAELRSTELSNLQTDRKNLLSQLKVYQRQLISVKSMYEDGIASEKDLMEAESNVNITESDLEKVNANLEIYSASAEKGVFLIKAPSEGYVVSKNIAPGMQIAGESDPLFTISNLNQVWVTVNVYAGDIRFVSEGMDVEIKTLTYPDDVFKGKIAALSNILDADAHVLKARVILENKDMKLKPGMVADVILTKQTHQQALSVPTSALVFDNNRNFLLTYHGECDYDIREVDILSNQNGLAFIGEGISAGEQIVTQNQLLVYQQLKNKLQ